MTRAHDRALVHIARSQHGLISAGQVRQVTGNDDAWRLRLRSGLWQEVLPGVMTAAAVELKDSFVASAAMLWDPTALLSHHEAAAREGIWTPDRERLRVTVPFPSTRRSLARLEVVRSRVLPTTYRSDGFHRWTPPARTLVDLAQLLTRKQLEAVLLSAVRLSATSAAAVDAEADRLPGRAGLGDLRRVTALWRPERESFLEDLLYGHVQALVTEEVVRQHPVVDRGGRLVARIDVAVPALRLAFEADGLAFHSTDEQIAADQRRDRVVLAHGWPTVRFREGTLGAGAAVRAQIAAIVERRRNDLRAA